ncbi:MAG TPA: amino acid adenylation domain-containing protein [Longimicrobium sp.]|nr:amino acid adenylation domain-containing protein [Longimicrobium sp.]
MSQDTSSTRADLSDAKRALLQARLRGLAPSTKQRVVIGRVAGPGPAYPMSFAQERMWFLDQLDPGSAVYNIAASVLVSSQTDADLLERALTEIVRRHEAIRTVFRLVDGKPMQIVQPPYPFKIERVDARGTMGEGEAWWEDVRRLAAEEGKRGFDLANGPVMRCRLTRVSDAEYLLSLTLHHIVTDGWSMPLVTIELEKLYEAFRDGKPSPLPELEIQFADYAVWQRDYLTGENLERHLSYWRDRLVGVPPLELPTDRPRPPVWSNRGAFHRFVVSPALGERLLAFCTRETVTLNMLVLAAFDLVLSRWSGQDDIAVATLLGNRNRAEVEPLVGLFVNTGVIRSDLSGDPTFHQLLGQARKRLLEADEHQELPFERVVDALGVQRDLSRNPVFQAMYFHHAFVKAHGMDGEPGPMEVRQIYENAVSLVDINTSAFDLMLCTLQPDAQGMSCMFEYATDLFDEATIARLSRQLVKVLADVVADPHRPISAYDIVPDEERAILDSFVRADAPALAAEPVHLQIARRAAETPDAVAVEAGGRRMTYAELDARANRVARRLRSLGVGAETVVAQLLERSPEMVAGLLGILKAGGAYLPVDPAYPADRIRYLLEDSGAGVVLTESRFLDRLADGVTTLALDRDAAAIDAESGEAVGSDVAADALAYVIYTSGSTGTPKGVEVTHGALAAHVASFVQTYGIGPSDGVLQFASPSFDVSLEQLFPALVSGARLVLRGAEAWSVAEFVEQVKGRGITVADPPTAYWQQLAAEPATVRELAKHLRLVTVGGEAMPPAAAKRWREADGGRVRLVNAYGPTEAVITATAWEVPADFAEDERTHAPIGRPLPGRSAYVLDPQGRPSPIGVPGELCLGGVLARGYRGRPELTAEKFVTDPFAARPGARMYRTGDLARWLADGTLEFIGRTDTQVKIRGFRIEPGEIDAALAAHPAVREAATVVREDAPGQKRLVAYVAADGDEHLPEALRVFVRERLPEHMVPASVVVLRDLPLTTTGKVDREALPRPVVERGEDDDAPGTRAERVLARVWKDVLGVDEVHPTSNFFALGGDSILSIAVIARAAQEGLRLTPKQVFQNQTLAEQAAVAEPVGGVSAEQGEVTGDVPLTPVQRLFFAEEMPEPAQWNLSLMLAAPADTDVALVEEAAKAVVAHHDALRMRFTRSGEGWTAFNAGTDAAVPFDRVDLSPVSDADLPGALAARIAEAQTGLDLASHVVRFAWLDLGPARGARLLIVAHHLVMDAVTWGLLREDVETAYAQLSRGEAVKLPAKTTSFREWARRLAEYANTEEAKAELEFWRSAVPSQVAPLPADRPGAPDTEDAAGFVSVSLDEDDTRALLGDAHAAYRTRVNDLLLAALARAFRRWTGEAGVLVDLEGHGREDLFADVDLSRTAGWFTTVFPVWVEAGDEHAPGEAVKGVKERLRRIPENGIGYGVLRWLSDDAAVREALAAQPKARVSFNYLGQFDAGTHAATGRFEPAREPVVAGRAASAPREHALAVDSLVAEGRLHLTWSFGTGVYDQDTVERLAKAYVDELSALVRHCLDPEAGGYTPSDFPAAAGLDQDMLDAIFSQIG